MATGDTPHITDAAHSHTVYSMNVGGIAPIYTSTGTAPISTWTTDNTAGLNNINDLVYRRFVIDDDPIKELKATATQKAKHKVTGKDDVMALRYVQVLIADTDENLPLDRRVIYKGDQKITDLTDQELFFEIDIKTILDSHNSYRTSVINKKVKERTEMLEPVKIRDLKMVVTTIAEFK